MMMVGILGDLPSATSPPPKIAVNSSSTILITCWAGCKASDTSTPMARARMFLMNFLTTGKATSASNKATRISLVISKTSFSVIFFLPRKFLKTPCKRWVKFSNAIIVV